MWGVCVVCCVVCVDTSFILCVYVFVIELNSTVPIYLTCSGKMVEYIYFFYRTMKLPHICMKLNDHMNNVIQIYIVPLNTAHIRI